MKDNDPKRTSGSHRLRVVAIRSFTTSDNDLIVAGTGGTLLCWARADSNPHDQPEARIVEVAWDSYMWNEIPEDVDADALPSTSVERDFFVAETHIDNIKLEGSR